MDGVVVCLLLTDRTDNSGAVSRAEFMLLRADWRAEPPPVEFMWLRAEFIFLILVSRADKFCSRAERIGSRSLGTEGLRRAAFPKKLLVVDANSVDVAEADGRKPGSSVRDGGSKYVRKFLCNSSFDMLFDT